LIARLDPAAEAAEGRRGAVNDRHMVRGLGELPVASPLWVRVHAISSRAIVHQPARPAYAALAAALLAIAVLLIAVWDAAWWQAVAFALAPDAAVLYGIAPGLARGQLHPRAVPLYNALHRFWGPPALAVAALGFGLPLGYVAGALAWGVHVAFDRVIGLRLRAPDGFPRRQDV
jgi:Domain of unknown function (DUF4260)